MSKEIVRRKFLTLAGAGLAAAPTLAPLTLSAALTALLLATGSAAQAARSRIARVAGWGGASGRVVDVKGAPIKGAELYANPLGVAENLILPWAMSDSRGRFQFKRLPWGRYLITAGKPSAGYPPGQFGEVYDTSHAPVVVLSAKHPRARLVVRLGPKAALLVLKIVDAETGKVLPLTGPSSPGMSWATRTPTKRGLAGTLGPGSTLFIPSARTVAVTISAKGFAPWHASLYLSPGERRRAVVRLQPLHP